MKTLVVKGLVWAAVLLALAGAWSMYTRPDFLVNLTDQLWSCF
ncbi:hypothetical protein [Hydrogenophaga sp.]|nr:hypothetical protein [Hydrogenophaga sp.]